MSEYTPTDDWAAAGWLRVRALDGVSTRDALAEWDRWLAEHDRQVKAEALRDAARALYGDDGPAHYLSTATWLKSRADDIEGAERVDSNSVATS